MPQNHKGFQLRYHPSGTLLCKFEHCSLPELSTISPTQKVLWVLLPALKPGDSLMAESCSNHCALIWCPSLRDHHPLLISNVFHIFVSYICLECLPFSGNRANPFVCYSVITRTQIYHSWASFSHTIRGNGKKIKLKNLSKLYKK